MRAEKHSAGQEGPGHHGPTAGDVDPFFPGIAHDQRAQGESKGHGEAHISQVKHGRMDHHFRILQQRVQARAVGWQFARHKSKGMGGEIQQQQEENLHRGNNGGRVGKKPGVSFVPQPQNQSVGRQQ